VVLRRHARRTGKGAPEREADVTPRPADRRASARDWPRAEGQQLALRDAVRAAEFAVLEAQQTGAPTGDLDELCRRLRLAAYEAVSSPSPGQPGGPPASAIEDLMDAARMIRDAAASAAEQAQTHPSARIPADSLGPQAEAIAARIADAAQAVARASTPDSQH
jgi:hypothetical protein